MGCFCGLVAMALTGEQERVGEVADARDATIRIATASVVGAEAFHPLQGCCCRCERGNIMFGLPAAFLVAPEYRSGSQPPSRYREDKIRRGGRAGWSAVGTRAPSAFFLLLC